MGGPRFTVICSSSFTPRPTNLPGYGTAKIQTPSFHLFGKDDKLCLPQLSECLAHQYDRSAVHLHEGGHHMPDGDADDEVWDKLRMFFEPFQRRVVWQPKPKTLPGMTETHAKSNAKDKCEEEPSPPA